VSEQLSGVTKRAVHVAVWKTGAVVKRGWAFQVEEEESERRDFAARGAWIDHMSRRRMDDAAGHVT